MHEPNWVCSMLFMAVTRLVLNETKTLNRQAEQGKTIWAPEARLQISV